MGLALCEKVLNHNALDDEPGEYRRMRVDAVLGHDATIALLIDEFRKRKLEIWDPSRAIFVNDHFSAAGSIERAGISRKFLRFARDTRADLYADRGICHQILVQHRLCQPGTVIVGADSHTIMGGALGSCSTGMGTTDILFALATGHTWMRTPPTIKLRLSGKLNDNCSGKDVILALLGLLGEGGAQYRCVEVHDETDGLLVMDERLPIANMMVEAGAKFGVFVPDEVTYAYCRERDGEEPQQGFAPDADAHYERELHLDLSELQPMVAKPWSPSNVVPLGDVEGTKVTMAFLGSCASGRIEDLRAAAEVCDGKTVHEDVRFVVIPASREVFQAALAKGYVDTLVRAGAMFNHTSCGPCGGIDKGVLAAEDVCVSTSTRNFRARMGHRDSQTYLASARTVAMAAIEGRLAKH